MVLSNTLVTAAVGVILLAAPAARAEDDVRRAKVPVADLDLSRADHQEELDRRLDAAARRVCKLDTARTLYDQRLERECRAEALSRAQARLAELRPNIGAPVMRF